MKEENLKILIATGIFPPDVGGPAKYAKNLQEQFLNRRFFVKVLAYGIEKKLPFFARHIFYFLKIIFNLNKVDLIIALDLISTGFPSVLYARAVDTVNKNEQTNDWVIVIQCNHIDCMTI